MALPRLEVPTYEIELPLSKKKLKYRPFLVKEQKNLLMAMDEKNIKEVLKNEDATMLEKTVAKAIIKSYEKGSLYSMDTLLSRVFGKPKESVEATVEAKVINVTLNLE